MGIIIDSLTPGGGGSSTPPFGSLAYRGSDPGDGWALLNNDIVPDAATRYPGPYALGCFIPTAPTGVFIANLAYSDSTSLYLCAMTQGIAISYTFMVSSDDLANLTAYDTGIVGVIKDPFISHIGSSFCLVTRLEGDSTPRVFFTADDLGSTMTEVDLSAIVDNTYVLDAAITDGTNIYLLGAHGAAPIVIYAASFSGPWTKVDLPDGGSGDKIVRCGAVSPTQILVLSEKFSWVADQSDVTTWTQTTLAHEYGSSNFTVLYNPDAALFVVSGGANNGSYTTADGLTYSTIATTPNIALPVVYLSSTAKYYAIDDSSKDFIESSDLSTWSNTTAAGSFMGTGITTSANLITFAGLDADGNAGAATNPNGAGWSLFSPVLPQTESKMGTEFFSGDTAKYKAMYIGIPVS